MSSSSAHVAKEHFTAEEQKVLERLGVHKSKPSGGKRKVSAQLLTPSSSLSGSSSSSSSASLRIQGRVGLSPPADVDLPTKSESIAALEFMGFEPVTAKAIFQTWEGREEDYPYDFLDHSFGRIENRSQGGSSYADFMSKVGLRKEFQDAILDPRFNDVFETENLKYWIRDTLASRHNTIEVLNARCHIMALRGGGNGGGNHAKKQARKSLPHDLEGFFGSQGEPSNVPVLDPNEAASLSSDPKAWAFPKAHVRIGAPVAALPNHTTLYKGRATLDGMIHPLIQADGTIDLRALNTRAGGDFNSSQVTSYWTPEVETAEKYRGYAARRDLSAETWILSIQVPNAFVSTLKRASLWYSADWKQYVWMCRDEMLVLPKKFDALADAQLIIGHICCKLQHIMNRIKAENVQEKIDADFCVYYKRPDGKMAKSIQWAFCGGETILQLSKQVKGKLHFDIHAPVFDPDELEK